MNDFTLKNPNNKLISYGIFLFAVSTIAVIANDYGVLIGLAIIVRVLALLWIPAAAAMVGRNATMWALFVFVVPPLGLVILGALGYKESPEFLETMQNCKTYYANKKADLLAKMENQEISEEEMETELSTYYSDLKDYAIELIESGYEKADNEYMNAQLEKHGYVLDENSGVFVDVKDKCPACGAGIKKGLTSCTECGLALE